ncbi:MAG: hypothetical protein LBG46_07475 [Elusimicrobiota bacterium]|jgi:hypothetical protein|nr:hypothetical protein [Elusimicrobiota bacterium]
MKLTHKEKLDLMKSINWDYNVSPEDMLAVVEGKKKLAGSVFDQNKIFVRSLERLPWDFTVAIWGIEKLKTLYSNKIEKQLHSEDLRRRYDFVFSKLRGESVSVPRWGDESYKRLQNTIFSNRWYRFK